MLLTQKRIQYMINCVIEYYLSVENIGYIEYTVDIFLKIISKTIKKKCV